MGNESFWQKGGWDDSTVDNPWRGQPHAAPFDQEFYLVLNVAVGGTNGYFPDGSDGKPWTNDSPTAFADFNSNLDAIVATWDSPAMQIRSVMVTDE